MGFLVNDLMVYHFKGLDKDDPYSLTLEGKLNILTPTPISYIESSILFDLITILYYNMYSSIDAMSDAIWTGSKSYMGKLSSTFTPHKSSAEVIIQKSITL